MNTEQIVALKRQDHALVRKVLLKLTATTHLLAITLLIIVAISSYALLSRLFAFGIGINYTGNQIVGADASALLQRYNPYFWWALLVLCSLLIIWFSIMAVRAIYARGRLKPIDAGSFQLLSDNLSAPALDVLLWSWKTRDEPLRIGDLLRTHHELSTGRAVRLQQAAQQLAILENARQRA